MSSASRFFLFFLTGLLNPLNAADGPASATYRAGTGLVLVPVTVTDRRGKTIQGLRKNDFTVLDELVPQEIVSFAGEDSPTSIELVLDFSGSIRTTANILKETAHAFLEASNPGDEFLLLTISTHPAVGSYFTKAVAALENDILRAPIGGGTAMLDAIYLGLNQVHAAARPRRAVLVLTDGMDNSSRYSKSELLRVAIESDAQIYTIVFEDTSANAKPIERAEAQRGWNALQELSDKTGGLCLRIRNVSQAKDAAARTAQAIRSQYLIGYRVPDDRGSGKWHRIRVRTYVPNVRVYARSGYYSR